MGEFALIPIYILKEVLLVSEVIGAHPQIVPKKHLAWWPGLCPGTKITGGKLMSGKTKRCANRAALALRLAAALRSSQSALGAYFRRLCSRMDKAKAVTAAAHKLAWLIYAMLTKREEYTDPGQDYYEGKGARANIIRRLIAMRCLWWADRRRQSLQLWL